MLFLKCMCFFLNGFIFVLLLVFASMLFLFLMFYMSLNMFVLLQITKMFGSLEFLFFETCNLFL